MTKKAQKKDTDIIPVSSTELRECQDAAEAETLGKSLARMAAAPPGEKLCLDFTKMPLTTHRRYRRKK